MKDATAIRTTCPRDCYDACGILVKVAGDGTVNVVGDPDHNVSRGALCPKCSIGYNGVWRDPGVRLTRPLRRVGPKGTGHFEPIEWDQALGDIANRLATGSLTDDFSFLLARANALSIAVGNAALSQTGLKTRSYSVLSVVADGSRPTQRELAEFLRLDPSQVVALVDALQARDLIAREADPSDRRANVLVATADGRKLAAAAAAALREAERESHSGLSEPSRAQLTNLLRVLAFPDRPSD